MLIVRGQSRAQAPVAGPGAGKTQTMSSVQHAIEILRCVSAANAPIGINQIARHVGLHKSSVSRVVATLERSRLVQRDQTTDRIELGMGLIAVAAPLLANLEIHAVMRPIMEELAADCGETVSFSIWDGQEAVGVEQATMAGTGLVQARPGKRNPGHCTASGKVLLAFEADHAIEDYCLRKLERFTESTIAEPRLFREELRRVRDRGYAFNLGEMERDIGAVAAAVRGRGGRVIGALTIALPIARFGSDRQGSLVERVMTAARTMSARLGRLPDPS